MIPLRDHRGERCLDHVVPELRLPLATDQAVRERQLGYLRDQRATQPVRERGPEDGPVRVVGLLAEEDQVGLLPLERLRERVARGDEVGACRGVVGHEHDPIGAHRERLPERIERSRRPERDEHDLRRGVVPLQPQGLLDGVRVEGIQRRLAGPVEPFRPRVDAPRLLGHGLYADGDLHPAADSTQGLAPKVPIPATAAGAASA
jgi:hypothetical protein